MKVKDLGEFALIERLQALLPSAPRELKLGIGDDAAVWAPSPGKELVLTCDSQVEGRHFFSLEDQSLAIVEGVGRRAALVNLSDLASMAAEPRFALVSLAIPPDYDVSIVEALYRGMARTFKKDALTIIGGNITSIDGPFVIDITVGGEVSPGKAVTRSGSQPGDWIGVTGYPGSSGAGLFCLDHEEEFDLDTFDMQPLIGAYLYPNSRVRDAMLIGPHVRAMTDISDGLLLDLSNILEASGVGATLDESKLPVRNTLSLLCKKSGRTPLDFVFGPSDDYELLLTAAPEEVEMIEQALASKRRTKVRWIGQVTGEGNDLLLHTNDGEMTPLSPSGWDHFPTE